MMSSSTVKACERQMTDRERRDIGPPIERKIEGRPVQSVNDIIRLSRHRIEDFVCEPAPPEEDLRVQDICRRCAEL